jgi:DNA processing protein
VTPIIAPLTEDERFDWLRLIRSEGIGPQTFIGLLQRFGTAGAALAALPALIRKRGSSARPLQIASPDSVTWELDRAHKRGLRFIALNEPDYPPALRVIDTAPPVICVRGLTSVLQKPMVAIVGSRNASGAGLIFTDRLVRGIGPAGFVIVSGLARGIDAKAHAVALPTGTVAVLAGGHDRVYPSEHEALARSIAETGAVVSEMPIGWEPRGRDFPRRNRIVSGLSLGTVVVEAARRSGSLITARLSNEQGREVFAVPGSPLDPRAEGTNDLLRQGATLCTKAEDVTEALGRMAEAADPAKPPLWFHDDEADGDPLFDDAGLDLTPTEPSSYSERWVGRPEAIADQPQRNSEPAELDDGARLLQLLGPAPTSIDDLVRLSGLSTARVRAILVDIEVGGGLERHGGALVSLTGR